VILVDQIDRDIAAGHGRYRAIVDATLRRARPVALTALAAILGMIPLAGSIFWGPMAITIMGGLFVATVLTLIVVPALYALWFRVRADEDATSAPATSAPATSAPVASAPTTAADPFPEGMGVQAWARWAQGKPTEGKPNKGTLTEAKEIA
jgi:multidrug efflux pump